MAYTVKKRCPLCRKVLDENGHCTNKKCVMSKVPKEDADNESKDIVVSDVKR